MILLKACSPLIAKKEHPLAYACGHQDLKKGIGELSRMIVGSSLIQIQVYSPFLDVKKE